METTRTTYVFGMDISTINYVYTTTAYGREFIIHPSVIETNNGKFEFPVNGCDVIEVTGKQVIVVPGNKTMRIFEVENGEIEDAYKSHMIYYDVFDREKWQEKTKAVIMVCSKEKKPTIKWVDGSGNRWMSTVDCETGAIETIPNPNPPPEEEEED